MNKSLRLYKHAGKLFSADAVNLALMTLFTIFLARAIGGESLLGIYSYSFFVATLVRSLIEAGYELTIPIRIAENRYDAREVIIEAQESKNLIWAATFVPGIIYGLFASFGTYYYIMLLIWNLSAAANSSLRSALRGIGGISAISNIEIKNNIILYGFLFILILIKGPFSAVFLTYIIFEIIKNIYYMKELEEEYDINLNASDIFKFSFSERVLKNIKQQWSYITINFAGALQFRSAFNMIGFIGSAAQGGAFSAAFRFITALRLIPGALYNAMLPEYAGSLSRNESSGFGKHLKISAIIGIIGFILLFFIAKPVIMWTYGISEAVDILRVLSLLFFTMLVNQTLEAYLLANGLPKHVSFYLFLTAGIGLASSAILFFKAGLEGAAFGQVVSEFALMGFYLYWALHAFKNKKESIMAHNYNFDI